jgi:hypothetical protein
VEVETDQKYHRPVVLVIFIQTGPKYVSSKFQMMVIHVSKRLVSSTQRRPFMGKVGREKTPYVVELQPRSTTPKEAYTKRTETWFSLLFPKI